MSKVNSKDISSLITSIEKIRKDNLIKSEDEDIDLQKITYRCFYDQVLDKKVDEFQKEKHTFFESDILDQDALNECVQNSKFVFKQW